MDGDLNQEEDPLSKLAKRGITQGNRPQQNSAGFEKVKWKLTSNNNNSSEKEILNDDLLDLIA